jgi:hypothetical protein
VDAGGAHRGEQLLSDRQVCPGEHGNPDHVGILGHRGRDDVRDRHPEPQIDHLGPGVPERHGDDLEPAVVPVQPGLGQHYPRTSH